MKNKIGIILVFILVTLSLLFSLVYLPYINNSSIYVIVENNTIWKQNNGVWSEINLRNLKRMSFDKLHSFDNDGYIGETYLNYGDDIEVYNSNFEKISMENGLLSIKTSKMLKNTNTTKFYNDIDESDFKYIEKIFNRYSIYEDGNMTSLKYNIDLNNDGMEDTIYSVSNFYNDEEKEKSFSIIFSVISDNIEIIEDTIIDSDKELREKASYLRYVVDIDSDNNYEFIILKTSYGDVENDCHTMYKYDNNSNKYIKIIGC